MARARVVVAHRAPDRPSIQIVRGETVVLGPRDADWPGFVWTTRIDGLGGWVPAQLFDGDSGTATALADYDTRELEVDIDEIITLHHELEQWWWAEREDGTQGWIPARALDLLDTERTQ